MPSYERMTGSLVLSSSNKQKVDENSSTLPEKELDKDENTSIMITRSPKQELFTSSLYELIRATIFLLLGSAIGALCAVQLRILLPALFTTPIGYHHADHDSDTFHPKMMHALKTSRPRGVEEIHFAVNDMNVQRACALEALARSNTKKQCNLVFLSSPTDESAHLVRTLQEIYPNIKRLKKSTTDQYFQESLLKYAEEKKDYVELLEFAARALALWHHGGTSIDLDRPVLKLPPSDKYVQQGEGALLQFPEPYHPALQDIISDIFDDIHTDGDMAKKKAINKLKDLEVFKDSGEFDTEITTFPESIGEEAKALCPVTFVYQTQ